MGGRGCFYTPQAGREKVSEYRCESVPGAGRGIEEHKPPAGVNVAVYVRITVTNVSKQYRQES